jgi:hypothetical protein
MPCCCTCIEAQLKLKNHVDILTRIPQGSKDLKISTPRKVLVALIANFDMNKPTCNQTM